MSLILDALKKAKDLAGRKPAAAPPAALASFRFGRPSRSQKIKRIGLMMVLGLVSIGALAYTVNFWLKRMSKPRAVLIQAPRPLVKDPAPEPPPPQEAAKESSPAPDQTKDKPASPQVPAPAVGAASPAVAKVALQSPAATSPAPLVNPPAQVVRRPNPA